MNVHNNGKYKLCILGCLYSSAKFTDPGAGHCCLILTLMCLLIRPCQDFQVFRCRHGGVFTHLWFHFWCQLLLLWQCFLGEFAFLHSPLLCWLAFGLVLVWSRCIFYAGQGFCELRHVTSKGCSYIDLRMRVIKKFMF